jgi:hypothetical protein
VIERLQKEKDDLERRIEEIETEGQKKLGEMEAEREKLLSQIDLKDAEITKQAKELEDAGPIEVEASPFQDPDGTFDMPLCSDIDDFINVAFDIDANDANIDVMMNALSEADIDLTVFDIFEV